MPDRMPRAAGEAKPRRSRLLWVGLPVFSVFAAFGIIVWLAYQDNARVPDGEPPLVRAIAGPYKLAPDDPGGRQVADQGEINALLRDEPGPALPERVLPLPEEPRAPIVRAAPPEPSPTAAEEAPATVAEPESSAPVDQAPPAQAARAPESADAPQADATQEAEAALSRLLSSVEPEKPSAEQPAAQQPAAPAPDAVAVPAVRPESPSTTATGHRQTRCAAGRYALTRGRPSARPAAGAGCGRPGRCHARPAGYDRGSAARSGRRDRARRDRQSRFSRPARRRARAG